MAYASWWILAMIVLITVVLSGFFSVHLYIIKRDRFIRERNKAEQELTKTMDMEEKVVSIVSHKLRSPLTAVNEGISIVLDGTTGDINDEQRKCLDTAKRNVGKITHIINDFMDFQEIESGKATFNFAENDINAVIQEVQGDMSAAVRDKGLDIILQLDDSLPKFRFDSNRISQVFVHLVNKAVTLCEKGSIKIATVKVENTVHVTVGIAGGDISKKDPSKSIQSFDEIVDPRTGRLAGTDLGLAISNEIVSRHEGRIWATSESGKGTTFHFILPVF